MECSERNRRREELKTLASKINTHLIRMAQFPHLHLDFPRADAIHGAIKVEYRTHDYDILTLPEAQEYLSWLDQGHIGHASLEFDEWIHGNKESRELMMLAQEINQYLRKLQDNTVYDVAYMIWDDKFVMVTWDGGHIGLTAATAKKYLAWFQEGNLGRFLDWKPEYSSGYPKK